MTDSKIVYVNDDYDSDQDNAIIYGGTAQETDKQPIEQVITPPAHVEQEPAEDEVQKPGPETEPEEPGTEAEPEAPVKSEQEAEPEEPGTEAEPEEPGTEAEPAPAEVESNEDEDEDVMFGGDGYRSEPDDASSVSSLDTDAILNVDPLYFRLTKFLQTGGEDPENVAEILKKINTNLELMNQNLMNLMNAKSSQ